MTAKMLVSAMYAIVVDDLKATGLDTTAAVERANEILLPVEEQRAIANRRAFAHLMPKETT